NRIYTLWCSPKKPRATPMSAVPSLLCKKPRPLPTVNKCKMNVQIEQSWKQVLQPEFDKPYFAEIVSFQKSEKQAGKIIYPPGPFIFNAFNTTPFDHVKVVILGQDPYHNPGQAHGLCFSVAMGVPAPPSLVNMYKEIQADLGIAPPGHGHLQKWGEQGVLLLNAALTVEQNKPMSHSKIGWHTFTDAVIQTLSD